MRGPANRDPIADAGLVRPAVQEIGEVRIPVEGSDKDATPRQFGDGGEGREQDVVPLVRRDRCDAEQLTAVGRTRREFGGVDAGLGHRNVVRP